MGRAAGDAKTLGPPARSVARRKTATTQRRAHHRTGTERPGSSGPGQRHRGRHKTAWTRGRTASSRKRTASEGRAGRVDRSEVGNGSLDPLPPSRPPRPAGQDARFPGTRGRTAGPEAERSGERHRQRLLSDDLPPKGTTTRMLAELWFDGIERVDRKATRGSAAMPALFRAGCTHAAPPVTAKCGRRGGAAEPVRRHAAAPLQ